MNISSFIWYIICHYIYIIDWSQFYLISNSTIIGHVFAAILVTCKWCGCIVNNRLFEIKSLYCTGNPEHICCISSTSGMNTQKGPWFKSSRGVNWTLGVSEALRCEGRRTLNLLEWSSVSPAYAHLGLSDRIIFSGGTSRILF